MSFDLFMHLRNCHHKQDSEHTHHPQKFPCSPASSQASTYWLSVTIDPCAFSRNPYTWELYSIYACFVCSLLPGIIMLGHILVIVQISRLFFFFFFAMPWRTKVPRPAIEPVPQQWQCPSLTARLRGNSNTTNIYNNFILLLSSISILDDHLLFFQCIPSSILL